MRNIFPGYFRPKPDEFSALWDASIFVFDANVLLNLYRYSAATRKELQDAINSLGNRLYISHQAASEFLRNRVTVTSDQSKEYTAAVKAIEDLIRKISSKDRHPFIDDDKLSELQTLSSSIIENLNKHQTILMEKLSNDEILEFVEEVFTGRTGKPFEKSRLDEIVTEGQKRYDAKIPPGYKDSGKDSSEDHYRKYGDLIVWLQTLDYAKNNNASVIFITDDKKEDWWLEQSGRTIGPRPELIEEFKKETGHNFWMYSVGKFVEETASKSQKHINPEILDEIEKISERTEMLRKNSQFLYSAYKEREEPSIKVSQEVNTSNENINAGLIIIRLLLDMSYATGSGKFRPELNCIPELDVDFIAGPEGAEDNMRISYGCGTTKDFNVHMKASIGKLPAGDYIFQYTAICKEEKLQA